VILPWCLRNSLLSGTAMGVDDIAVENLLQVFPNPRFVPLEDLDLATEGGSRIYYQRLQRANRERRLSRRSAEIVGATFAGMARRPLATARRFAVNLAGYLAPLGDEYFQRIFGERRRCRTAAVTDLMNAQYLLVMGFGVAGLALAARDRRLWPLALWFVFNAVAINLLFHPEPKYRFPTLPVPMVFAGHAVVRLGERLGRSARLAAWLAR
jgi:hypothetical protein